ncbi:MAG: DAK2 domain-containing protein [Caldilineaceae bacterium]|nr:DAK2 domain-containing protein [Caldilineaceae bacterium]
MVDIQEQIEQTAGREAQLNQEQEQDLAEKYPAGEPIIAFDATDLRSLFRAAYAWLGHNYELVNRLNVFPVPDGDTGTNMLLTIKSAWFNIVERGGLTVGDVAEAAAEGAHHGSRGNSGVILGQILHGFSQSLHEKATINASDLAAALRQASEAAYSAVPAPVEGTILTVSKEISLAAESAARKSRDLRAVLAHIVEAADLAVRRTPELLPVLKHAGVVDSGGKGLFFVFDGMYRALTGQPVQQPEDVESTAVVKARFERTVRKGHRPLPPVQWGFDVQFLIEQPNKPIQTIASDIAAMGDCPLVEGDDHLVKVHVHVPDPGVALSYGVKTGFITDVIVENMDDMAVVMQDQLVQGAAAGATAVARHAAEPPALDEETTGVVVVAPGTGFAGIFTDLGAHSIVEGGQSMNPSVAEIAGAIRQLPTRKVIVLPNNSNIHMAAQQAAKLTAKDKEPREVKVIATRTVPQGVAALMAYDPSVTDLNELVKRMANQLDSVESGEVTQAVRTADVDGVKVQQGDMIGLRNGKLVSCGSSLTEVALDLLHKMDTSGAGLITIYYGDFVAQAAAQNFADLVRDEYPDQDVELAYGGQPHYHFILSVE